MENGTKGYVEGLYAFILLQVRNDMRVVLWVGLSLNQSVDDLRRLGIDAK